MQGIIIMENDKNKEQENKTVGMNLPMHESLMKRLYAASLDSNLAKAAYVRQAIEEKLKRDGF
jgi:predicted DNA-binding protein